MPGGELPRRSSIGPGDADADELKTAYGAIRAKADRLAGAPGDMPRRVAVLHSIFLDSGGNHAFPEIALHGALWAYGFYDRRGTVSELIAYRYFYDPVERARRAEMLGRFSDGFKVANRSVFTDTYANYHFTKRHGTLPGAEQIVAPELLDALNRMHDAVRRGRRLSPVERAGLFETSLLFEQETTVGPKVREQVEGFDCPILTTLVLKPMVRFAYFPRGRYLLFRHLGDTEERIEKAVRSYEMGERAGWDAVAASIRTYGSMPEPFFADPVRYAEGLYAEGL